MIPEINPFALAELLKTGGDSFVLIDVREPEEHALVRLEPSVLIPLMQLPDELERLRELSKGGSCRLIIYCRSGQRSAMAVQFLTAQQIENSWNLRGGINAYSREVDPSLPQY